MAIGRDPVRCHAGHRLGGAKERLRGSHVAVFTEQHVHERAGAVDGAIEITPAPMHLQVRLILSANLLDGAGWAWAPGQRRRRRAV